MVDISRRDEDPVREPITRLDILWITAGLGCDGETIALTGATQPSLEELVLGGIPWTPQIALHNPLLSPGNGDQFLDIFHRAAQGAPGDPFLAPPGHYMLFIRNHAGVPAEAPIVLLVVT